MDPAFSRRGEVATEFERTLVEQPAPQHLQNEQELWLVLSRQLGLDAMFRVFDELGGRKVWIPTRESFVQILWSDIRNREIRRLHIDCHLSIGDISARLGVNQRSVRRVVQHRPFGAAPKVRHNAHD